MSHSECPKWDGCNAPVCPEDPNWRRVSHLPGERICLWLREVGKAGGNERVLGTLPGKLGQAVVAAHLELTSSSVPGVIGRGQLRKALLRAAASSSKIAAGSRMRAAS